MERQSPLDKSLSHKENARQVTLGESGDQSPHTKIKSSIRPTLMRRTLLRGTCIASFGALLLIIGGIFSPPSLLRLWGLPLFLAALGLIALGLIPYRLLRRLEMNPHLLVVENAWVHFYARGKPLFFIPIQSIANISWLEKNSMYGISLDLKNPITQKVQIENKNFDFQYFCHRCQKKYQHDLFFPFFSENSFKNLRRIVDGQWLVQSVQ